MAAMSPERRERQAEAKRKYAASGKAAEAQRRYLQTPAGKASRAKYAASEKGQAARAKTVSTPEYKAAEAARRAERPSYDRGAYLLRTYGLTEEQYEAILAHQGGVCAICHRPPKTKRLAVDHDHRTGQVRGLLCSDCNHSLLGRRDKDPGLFLRAHDYLVGPPAAAVVGEHGVPVRPKKRRRGSASVTRTGRVTRT